MKILTWNIQWGLGMDRRLDLQRLVDHIRASEPDVICLQEIADNMPDLEGSTGEDQFAVLAGLLPGYAACEGPGLVSFDASGRRRFGNMILSRAPLRQARLHSLPWMADGRQSMPRVLLEALVEAPGGPLRVMTTHLEYFSGEARAAQVEAILRVYGEGARRAATPPPPKRGPYAPLPHTASTVLTGDFNMKPHDPTRLRLTEGVTDGPALRDAWRLAHPGQPHPPSFCIADQTWGPPHCCDFIFVSADLAGRVDNVTCDGETRLSDHQPVLLKLKTGEA